MPTILPSRWVTRATAEPAFAAPYLSEPDSPDALRKATIQLDATIKNYHATVSEAAKEAQSKISALSADWLPEHDARTLNNLKISIDHLTQAYLPDAHRDINRTRTDAGYFSDYCQTSQYMAFIEAARNHAPALKQEMAFLQQTLNDAEPVINAHSKTSSSACPSYYFKNLDPMKKIVVQLKTNLLDKTGELNATLDAALSECERVITKGAGNPAAFIR